MFELLARRYRCVPNPTRLGKYCLPRCLAPSGGRTGVPDHQTGSGRGFRTLVSRL